MIKLLFSTSKVGERSFFLCLLLFGFSQTIQANQEDKKYYYEYTPTLKLAYKSAIALKLDQADAFLNQVKQNDPYNLTRHHIENYVDFFYLFVTENEVEFKKREKNKKIRLAILDKAGVEHPQYRFIKAEILLHWALIRLKFDQKLTAGSEIYEAYKLLEANKASYPQFVENKKSLSIMHALAESLPTFLRKIIGVEGSILQAVDEITTLSKLANDRDYLFREEVLVIKSYIFYYQANRRKEAIKTIEEGSLDHSNNPMLAFFKANLALKDGRNNDCIKYLGESPKGSEYLSFHYMDFMLGRSLLYKLDSDADKYLVRFLDNFKGRHYIKEAYQKLAWSQLLFGKGEIAYQSTIQKCISRGHDLLDEDKQAMQDAKQKAIPNILLLKARLLYDGGYFDRAEKELKHATYLSKGSRTISLEYYYRLGRTQQSLKKYYDAIPTLKNTISIGRSDTHYFACNAALQLGLIYEELSNCELSNYYYNQCLSMNPSAYKTSLHQKAKSGKERCK